MKATINLLAALSAAAFIFGGCVGDEILLSDEDTSGNGSASLTDPELKWSASSYQATIGGDNTFPSLTNTYGVSVTYSSSSTDVATIASDGSITLKATGVTTIAASSEATSTYEASSASYQLTVVKSEDGISWSESSCTATIGEDNTFPTLSNPGNQTVEYSSSNEGVATISSSGVITLVAAGTTTITATAQENDSYEGTSAFFTLEVIDNQSNLKSAGLSWSETSFEATLASDNTFPTLSNPNRLDVAYSSSNTSVATIDSEGNITLTGAGNAVITATSDATDTYSAGSATFNLKVVKHSVTLSWSSGSCTAILEEEDNEFPSLTVSPEDAGLSIEYSSSNTSVATISGSGSVSLVAGGSTTISATFEGDDTYKAASASYTLVVTSGSDDGAGSFSFDSTGDTSSDDDISNTTFTRMITITYSSGGATIAGDYYGYASSSGAHVTVNNTGSEYIVYRLTGSTSNGSFKLYSSKKQAILLDGVSITNPSGAAINNQSGKRTFVMIEGSNTISDGSSAAYTSESEDMKAVLFSEGQLILSGSGTLTVNAANSKEKSAITSDDYVRVMSSPTIKITSGSSAGHGLRGKEYVRISDGTLSISTSAAKKKGIGSDDYVLVEGGNTTINVSGGVAYDSDDSEYKGSAGIKADNYFAMTGGVVTIKNTGSGGKGISAGSYDYDSSKHTLSDSYISGGTLTITTTGNSSNDVSPKGLKIGYKQATSSSGRNSSYTYAGNLVISGGLIEVSSSKDEGIEAKGNLTVTGGYTYGYSGYDDGINCQGDMTISGGYICAWTAGTQTGADGFDANGNIYLKGGVAYGICTHGNPDVAFDANSEENKKLYITGGSFIAVGGLESGFSMTGSAYSASSWGKSTWYGLFDSDSKAVVAFKTPTGGNSLIVYSAGGSVTLKSGVSMSGGTSIFSGNGYAPGTLSGGTSVSLSTYSGSSSGGGGGFPGGGGGPGGRGR